MRLRGGFLRDLIQNIFHLWPLWIIFAVYILTSSLFIINSQTSYAQAILLTTMSILGISMKQYDASRLPTFIDVLDHLFGLFFIGIVVWLVTESIRGNIE